MKRVLIALLLLAAVTGGCFFMIRKEQKNTAALLAQTEVIEQLYRSGKAEELPRELRAFSRSWKENTTVFFWLMRHEEMEKLQETIDVLPFLWEDPRTREDFLPELIRCRSQLKRLQETETPVWKNIL